MNTHEKELMERLERCVRLFGSGSPSAKMLQEELRRAKKWVQAEARQKQLEADLAYALQRDGSDSPAVKMLRDELQHVWDGVREPFETYISGFRGTVEPED